MDFVVKYWLQVLFGVIIAVMGWVVKKINAKLNDEITERKAIKTAMVAMLHDRLFQTCRYHIENGYIPIDKAEEVLDNVGMIYRAYSDLGGNGTGTNIYNRFTQLPLKDGKNERETMQID